MIVQLTVVYHQTYFDYLRYLPLEKLTDKSIGKQ